MKFKTLIVTLSLNLIFLFPALADWIPLSSGTTSGSQVSFVCTGNPGSDTVFHLSVPGVQTEIRTNKSGEFTALTIPGAGLLWNTGAPQLPVIRRFVAVPAGSEVTVSAVESKTVVLDGYHVMPAQPQYKRNETAPPFQIDEILYQSDKLYPGTTVDIADDVWMRDYRAVLIEVNPVQYNPATGQLRIAVEMDITVHASGSGKLQAKKVFPAFYSVYEKNLANFNRLDISVRSDPEPMLIISDDAFLTQLAAFIQWKTKKGLDVVAVPTSVTGSSASAVQSYIQNAYNSWDPKPVYVLLVGDSSQINPLYGIGSCASDYLFTLLEGGDYVPDVFISRLSAQNTSELAPQLDKIMHYEMTPDAGPWLDHITGISSSSSGPAGINDDERLDEIAARWQVHNPDCQVDRLYVSNSQGTTSNIADAVNEGRFWVSYYGHGSGTSWSGPYFGNSDVDALTNGYLTPFVMDVSCENGGFASASDCFAERWMKGGTVGNAHGAVGMYSSSTSTDWDPSAILGWGVCFSVTGDTAGTMPGGNIIMGKMAYDGMMYAVQELGAGSSADELMQQYVLFGDCSNFMRSDALITPVVTHLPSAPMAPTSFQVTVTDAKTPVEGALVCAFKPGDVHVTALTDNFGVATLNIYPTEIGDMFITVTGANLLPYEGIVTVAPAGCGVVLMDKNTYNCDDTIVMRVFDADLNVNPNSAETVQVDIRSISEPSPEVVTLTETGPDTGIFSGTIQTSDSQSGPGYLLISHNEVITLHYHDEDCDGVPTDVTDTATADCQGPVISNLMFSNITTDSITISWSTNEDSDSVVYWGETIPPQNQESDSDLTTNHEITLTDLENCTEYFLKITSTDAGGNTAVDDNSGNYYNITTLQLVVFLQADMNTDPGWNYEGDWSWGQPSGSGGDPDSGYTGDNVVGYNLNGAYGNGISATYLTTPTFDCSGASEVYLSFWKWLGVESSQYDHATLEASGDGGATWSVVWTHDGPTVEPSEWTFVEYDISEWVAGSSNAALRWGMGPSDSIVSYCGWNIDDVTVSYTTPCNVPLLTHGGHTIDDSLGNNDGEINGGETISMFVTLDNNGLDATGVSATLSSANPHVTFTTNTATFPDIAQSSSGTSLTPFVFTVDESVSDGETIPFTIAWTCTEASGTAGFSEMAVAPSLEYDSFAIVDTSGDQDGILDPGETVQILVVLNNTGTGFAHNVSAVLSSDTPQYITIVDNSSDFPDIPGNGSGSNIAPYFSVTADVSTPDHTNVTFQLDISADGYTSTATFETEVTVSTFSRRLYWNMDTDPDWNAEGDWAWGVPQGSDGDPTSGYTGENVYGYNLGGSYTNNMQPTNLTAGPFDFSAYSAVEIRFMRWLGVESASYDHASFAVSVDGTNWTTIWEHAGSTLTETDWTPVSYDLSQYVDGESSVYLRWVMGESDSSVTYCGWNIDDVEIWAESSSPNPTFTPVPPTNTPVPPTETPIPPTNTPVPPTDTPIPPTNTPVPPTNTPVPPTDTPVPPTYTHIPPTATTAPTFTPEPTNTPIPDKGMKLAMEDIDLGAGDELYLHMFLYNPDDTEYTADTYILLGLYDNYWCWPSWTDINSGLDSELRTVPAMTSLHEDILLFEWPSGIGVINPIYFYGALFEPGTWNLIGEVQVIQWQCH